MPQPNRTKATLLGFLSWGPMSGYDLQKIIEGSVSNFWSESFGRIYPMLTELAAEGLTSCTRTESDGGRPRNIYEITSSGLSALDEWLAQPVATTPIRDERLLKLFFGARSETASSQQLLKQFQIELEEKRSHYEGMRTRIEAAKEAPLDQRFWLMTLRYGELKIEAELEWCREVLDELAGLERRGRR